MKATILTITLCARVLAFSQSAQHAPLAEQKMCDEQAHKRVKQYSEEQAGPKKNSFQLGGSHYDPDARICYFQYSFSQDDPSLEWHYNVEDAFEGKGFGSFVLVTDAKTKQVQTRLCSVKPLGKDEIKCESLSEWFSLLEKHFGL